MGNGRPIAVWWLPLAATVYPLLAGTVSAVIAMQLELVPSCMPFLEGCTSISATGRYIPASYVFKGLLLPYGALLMAYWWLAAHWLSTLGPPGADGAATVLVVGLIGCVCLGVYVVLLGSQGAAYEFMRRFGVYVFFLFTVIAQWRLASAYRHTSATLATISRWQRGLAIGMVLCGAANLILKEIVADPDSLENIIEWNFAVVMFANLGLLALAWRATGFRLSFQVGR